MNVNLPETCFLASAILRALETNDLTLLNAGRMMRFTNDTLEQERSEVLEAILSDMGHGFTSGLTPGLPSGRWDVNRRLLEHLAQPQSGDPSTLVH